MGKMAILLVIGVSMIVGIVAMRFNNARNGIVPGLVQNVSGFQKYTMARNIAHTGVNMMLRRLDRNDTAITGPLGRSQTAWMISDVMGGRCSVSVKLTSPPVLDTIDITAKAKYVDSSKGMIIRLTRRPVPFPTLGEALMLRTNNVNFDIDGASGNIDGRDHDIAGNVLPSPPDTNYKPAVGVMSSSDSAKVAAFNSQLTASGQPKVKVDTNMADPALYVQDYINAADYKYTGGVYGSNITWGSPSNPVIVYADGSVTDVKFTGAVSGYGILVVKGDIWVSGNFSFHGLVMCYNDVVINRDTLGLSTGTPDIIGAAVLAGAPGSSFVMKGNGQISYSAAALEMARFINKLQVYRVLRWYE